MSRMTRQELIDLAINAYFANVDKKAMEAVLATCHDDCVVTVQPGPTVHSGVDAIRKMFETLFSSYDKVWHGDFEVTADEENQSVSARFNVHLEDAAGNVTRLSNCNFWYVEGGKFRRYFVYMSGQNVLP